MHAMMSSIWIHMEAPPLSWMLQFRLLVKEVSQSPALVPNSSGCMLCVYKWRVIGWHSFDDVMPGVVSAGLLCITCTDMAVMAGNNGETCYSKYGSVSIKSKYCHEMVRRAHTHTLGGRGCRGSHQGCVTGGGISVCIQLCS